MVAEPEQNIFSEQVTRKADEIKQKAFEDECKRLDAETAQRANDLAQLLRKKEEQQFQERLTQTQIDKRKREIELSTLEQDARQKIEKIILAKIEARHRLFEEQRKKIEEERRVQEEIERKRLDEEEAARIAEEKLKQEADELLRQEEERIRKQADDERRREDEQRRRENDQKQREDEQRKRDDDRKERIRSLLENANHFYQNGEYEQALVEVAKTLVNDPANQEALELEAKIKIETGEFETVPGRPDDGRPRPPKKVKETKFRPAEIERKPKRARMISLIAIAAIIVIVIIVIQIQKSSLMQPISVAMVPWSSATNILEDKIVGSSLAEEVSKRFECVTPQIIIGSASARNVAKYSADPSKELYNLGYQSVLQGSLKRSGENFSIELKLVDSSGNVEWSNHYLRSWSDLADLPGDISIQLADALNISPKQETAGFRIRRTNTNPDSYFFYLRGLEILHRNTKESVANAYQLFLQAAQQDPNFAEGLAAAANALLISFQNGWIMGDSVLLQARHLAEGAVNANPTYDRGYLALGRALAYQKKFRSALTMLDSSLVFAPNNSEAYLELGKIYLQIGKYNEALNELIHACKLNPRSPDILCTAGMTYQLLGLARQGLPYHETSLNFVEDSLGYLSRFVADAVSADPDLRLNHGQRLIVACEKYAANNPADFLGIYRISRLRQLMGLADADSYFRRLENSLQNEIRENPRDALPVIMLGLTLTRMGRFSEGSIIARRAYELDRKNADILYKIAQMFSIQMYSQKEKKFDETKKEESLKYLRQAIALNYRLDELVNADFYNMFDRAEYRSTIQEPLK